MTMMVIMTMMMILMMQQEAEDDTDSSSVVTKKGAKANHLLFQTLESKSCAGPVPTLRLDIVAIDTLDHENIRNIVKIR